MMRVSFGSPDLTCSVCIEPYDLQIHKPMVLCLNMHTICLECAKRTKSKLCPFCKRKYQLKDLVSNRYLIQQIKTKFPDVSSQNQISNNSQSQKVLSQTNQFNGGYFNNSNQANNNISNNNDININPYDVNPVRQNNVMIRQINYSQNLNADNNRNNAIIRVNRSNPSNTSNNINANWNLNSNNNARYPQNRNQQNQVRPNNYHLNPVQPVPRANDANNVKNCCMIVTIILLLGLAVYFVSQGQDYYGGAAACSIASICGCISILCKSDERNQRDVYVYQPNR